MAVVPTVLLLAALLGSAVLAREKVRLGGLSAPDPARVVDDKFGQKPTLSPNYTPSDDNPFGFSTAGGPFFPAYPGYICDGQPTPAYPLIEPKCAPLLPFTISRAVFDQHLDPAGEVYQDTWTGYESGEDPIEGVPDGIPEVILPLSPSGGGSCSGNSGALNIMSISQGAPAFAEQVLNGLTQQEVQSEIAQVGSGGPFDPMLSFYETPSGIQFGNATVYPTFLTGNPGLPGGNALKDALDARIGDVVAVFIHDECVGSGADATYDVSELCFVILLDYKLQGGDKCLKVQPCNAPAGYLLPFGYRWNDWYIQADPNTPPVHDDWSLNGEQMPDGIPEVWLKPFQAGQFCLGSFGALNIGLVNQGFPAFAAQIRYGVTLAQLEEEIGPEGLAALGSNCGWIADDLQTQAPGPGIPPIPSGQVVVSPSANFIDPTEPVVPGFTLLDIGEGPDEGFYPIATVLSPTELELVSSLTSDQPHLWYHLHHPGDSDTEVSGNPGLSVGQPMRDALEARLGDIVAILLYDDCEAGGADALYNIICIKYGKLLDFKLTGPPSQRRIVVQPVPTPGAP